MKEWQELPLSEVVELIGGGTPKTSVTEYWNGDIPWLSVVDFNTGRKYVTDTEKKITNAGLTNSSTKMLNAGDIILSARGTVGAIAVLSKPMTFNQSCYGLRGVANKSETAFIYYLVKDAVAGLQQISHGGVFDTITKDTFKDIALPIPPIEEQKAIASVLSSLDDKIDLLHRQNTTLERMAETLFRQWFVEESQENWEECTLNDLISVKGGTTPSTKELSFWNGNVNWTSPRDLSNQQSVFMFDTERKITEKGLAQIGSGLLPLGTVLMSSRAPIGYLAITDIPVAINQGYIAIVCDKLVSNYFMYLWCKVNMERIKNSGNGSTFEEISKSNFKALLAVIPPKQVLENFHQKVEPIFRKVKCNQQQIKTLEKLRESLLPKLMSGEVTVELGEINE